MVCHVRSCDPQFPWVLVDYESPELNLEDPSVFRDFTKPVGIQNPHVEKQVKERWGQHHMTSHMTHSQIIEHGCSLIQPHKDTFLMIGHVITTCDHVMCPVVCSTDLRSLRI